MIYIRSDTGVLKTEQELVNVLVFLGYTYVLEKYTLDDLHTLLEEQGIKIGPYTLTRE